MSSPLVAALDPGRSKCGLVLADATAGRVLQAAILTPDASRTLLQRWRHQGLEQLVLGDGTGSRSWEPALVALGLTVLMVDERGSTLAARQRYWQLREPGGGWRRWLPPGLRLPPRDIDDVVAQLLLERHLQQQLQRPPQPPLRNVPAP
jgi:RNase H-fold protein (predicted Holliday junction resolvase)